MTPEEQAEIKAAKTIKDVFNVFDKYYNLAAADLSTLAKNILLSNMSNIVNFLKVPRKNES